MKRFIVLLSLILILGASPIYAQIIFQRWYGGNNLDYGYSVAQTTDGGYIITGSTSSYGAGSMDVYLIKTDSTGDTIWTRTYGGTSYDVGRCVKQTTDGGYIITGDTWSFGSDSNNIYLIKTDDNGDTVWTKTYGGTRLDYGSSVAQTLDGGYIVGGWTRSYGAGSFDIYVIKADANGDSIWTRTYGGVYDDRCTSIIQTSDSGYVLTGWTSSYGAGDWDVYLIKLDAGGDTVWTRTYGGFSAEIGAQVVQPTDGGLIIAGYTYSYGAGNFDVYLIKTDATGDTIWTKTFGGANLDWGTSVAQTMDGGYIVTGYTFSYGAGQGDVYLIKTDANGDTIWTKTYGGVLNDWGYSVAQTTDHGYVVAGYTASYAVNNIDDVYLIKTDSTGYAKVEEKGVEQRQAVQGVNIIAYPNPFSRHANMSIVLSGLDQKTKDVVLNIYDISGRMVKNLSFFMSSASRTKITWDGTDNAGRKVPTGIYFMRLKSGHSTVTGKIVKIR